MRRALAIVLFAAFWGGCAAGRPAPSNPLPCVTFEVFQVRPGVGLVGDYAFSTHTPEDAFAKMQVGDEVVRKVMDGDDWTVVVSAKDARCGR